MSNSLQTFNKINPLGHIAWNIRYLYIPSLGLVTQDMHISINITYQKPSSRNWYNLG